MLTGNALYTHRIWYPPSAASYWNNQSRYSDTAMNVAASDAAFGWSSVSIIWARTPPTGGRDDNVQIDLAFTVNPTATTTSSLDPPTHMSQVESDLDTWWTALGSYLHADFTLKEYRWHDYKGYAAKPGPAVRKTARSSAGSSGGTRLPDQDAATVSFTTASRKHWGRVFMPGYTSSYMTTGAVLASAGYVDPICTAFHTLFANVVARGWGQPVVSSKSHSGLLEISTLQMDNVPDIQRRRRTNQSTYKKIFTS